MKNDTSKRYMAGVVVLVVIAAFFYLWIQKNDGDAAQAPIAAQENASSTESIHPLEAQESMASMAEVSSEASVDSIMENADSLSSEAESTDTAKPDESQNETISAAEENAAQNQNTPVGRAKQTLTDEIANADKTYISDHTFVTVTARSYGGMNYYLTHIIIDSPTQIRGGLSHDVYGGARERPSDASKRLHWVVGINGSNFSYATGGCDTSMADVIIKNGQIMPDSQQVANGFEVCLTKEGELFSPLEGWTADELIQQGITNTFTCGDTLLIEEGLRVYEEIQSQQLRYPRTAVGMVKLGEYYFLTTLQNGKSGGGTYTEVRDALREVGCIYAKCMDGGGSSTLVFQNEVLNRPADGSERPVADFLYIVDSDTIEDDTFIRKQAD